MSGPVRNREYYKPLETPVQFPLELRMCRLNERLEILLWNSSHEHCWSIAAWHRKSEGFELHFIGDRPLDKRVKWKAFKKCVKQGQDIADEMFNNGVDCE